MGSILKKEAVSGSKLGSDYLYTELEAEAKNVLLLPHPWFNPLLTYETRFLDVLFYVKIKIPQGIKHIQENFNCN